MRRPTAVFQGGDTLRYSAAKRSARHLVRVPADYFLAAVGSGDMEIGKAKEIVAMLANGVHPRTGEIFHEDSPYHDPLIIRALFTIINVLEILHKGSSEKIEDKQKLNIVFGKPKNAGLPWTDESRKAIATMFNQGKTIEELAHYFQRSRGAIRSELKHQGLIE